VTHLSPGASAFLGLTGLLAALMAIMVFALMRFAMATRDARRSVGKQSRMETALLSAALRDAVAKLKAQERATAARAEASERLSGEIIASLTAGLLVAGLDGHIRILNPAGRRMLDVPDDSSIDDCRRRLAGTPLMQVIEECLQSGEAILRRAVTVPAAGPSVSHLGVSVSPLFEDHGPIHGAICLFTDLTAVKNLEEQLRLKNSLAELGELTAGIAHEFRNGLATIHGYSKLIDLDGLPEKYRPYVEGIRSEAESLGQVVTNFLNFARPAQLTLSRVALQAICARAVDEIRSEARALGGDVEISGTFGVVEGDEVLLRQAFSNLLRNAMEACAGASTPPRIVVQSQIDAVQRLSRVIVNDNGPGIPSGSRDRVFRPFVTSKRNGTGLGLALVQKIVVFHNGRVSVGASPYGGAALQVTLPIVVEC